MNQNKIYTVVQQSANHFNIVDANSGVYQNRITIQGKVISGPIVVGNRCTFVVENTPGSKFGLIYGLPQGTLVNRYMV